MAKTTMGQRTREQAVREVAQMEPVPEPVPVTVEAQGAQEEARWEAAQAARQAGTLKGTLITAVRRHAQVRIEDEEDLRWAAVTTLTDDAIWTIVQWCDFEKGAINLMARQVNQWAKAASPAGEER